MPELPSSTTLVTGLLELVTKVLGLGLSGSKVMREHGRGWGPGKTDHSVPLPLTNPDLEPGHQPPELP